MATTERTPRRAPARADAGARPAVEARGLTKNFGELVAVNDVSFEVRAGEIFGFLGPNGAGKSTTIKMLCTLIRPTGGEASVAGCDVRTQPKSVRRRIGLVFQEQTLDQQLTAEENLRFHAVLYRVPREDLGARIERVLSLVGLQGKGRDLVSTFSGGMARRLEIARALLHTPEVLFLDEPTLGLDPQTRRMIWEDLRRLRRDEGVTIFLTTHYMDEAEFANRIAIIDHGRIIALDTPDALKAAVGADTVTIETVNDESACARLCAAGYDAKTTKSGVVVMVEDGASAVAPLIAAAATEVRNVRVHRPSLDDVFLHFTGREIRDQGPDGRMASGHMMAMRARFGGGGRR